MDTPNTGDKPMDGKDVWANTFIFLFSDSMNW